MSHIAIVLFTSFHHTCVRRRVSNRCIIQIFVGSSYFLFFVFCFCRLIFIVVVIVRAMVLKLDFRVGSFVFFDSRNLFDALRFIPEIPRYISIHFDTFRYISIHFSQAYFYYQKAPDTFRYISIHFDTFSIHFLFLFFFVFAIPPPPCAAVCAAVPLYVRQCRWMQETTRLPSCSSCNDMF